MSEGDFRDRLKHRAADRGIGVPDSAVDSLEAYMGLLAKWAATINLTSLPLDPPADETLDRLLLEPLAAAKYVPDRDLIWIDLGSGGGSPALPLKIVRPNATLVMVEPKGRKVAFLREAVRALNLKGARVEPVRFQDLDTELHRTAHLLTVRALRVDADLAASADRLLGDDGQLFLFGAPGGPEHFRGFQQVDRVGLGSASNLTIHRRVPRGT